MKMWDANAFECESCTFECQYAQKKSFQDYIVVPFQVQHKCVE
jgi:hypothetical protein